MKHLRLIATLATCAALSSLGLSACAPPPKTVQVLQMTWTDATTGTKTVSTGPNFTIPAHRAGRMTFTTDLDQNDEVECALLWEGEQKMRRGEATTARTDWSHELSRPGMEPGKRPFMLDCSYPGLTLNGYVTPTIYHIVVTPQPPATHLYWSSDAPWSGVGRVRTDGGDPDRFVELGGDTDFDGATILDVAVTDRFVFWAQVLPGSTGIIGRAKLDGSGVNRSFVSGIKGDFHLAANDQHLYWVTFGGEMGRVRINGSDLDRSFADLGANGVFTGLAVDQRHVYWSYLTSKQSVDRDRGVVSVLPAGGYIGRAELSGNQLQQSFIHLKTGYPVGVEVNSHHLYWGTKTNEPSGYSTSVSRGGLDGDDVQAEFLPEAAATHLAVDDTAIYWSTRDGQIVRADIDGDRERTLLTGGGQIAGLALGDSVAPTGKPNTSISTAVVNFGEREVGRPYPAMPLTISNVGTADLVFDSSPASVVGPDAGDFPIEQGSPPCTGSVKPGSSCLVHIRFSPRTVGNKSAELRLYNNDSSSPQTVALWGTGTTTPVAKPTFSASPSPLDFGDTQVLFGKTADLTVTNTGTADLVFGAGAVQVTRNPTAFAVTADRCSSTTVAPGATCTVQMYFHPGAEGPDSGEVQFSDNADNSPQTVTMTGIGIPFAGVS